MHLKLRLKQKQTENNKCCQLISEMLAYIQMHFLACGRSHANLENI